jgi:hypothetical protein
MNNLALGGFPHLDGSIFVCTLTHAYNCVRASEPLGR